MRTEAKMKMAEWLPLKMYQFTLTLLHSERPKLYANLAFLSTKGLSAFSHCVFCLNEMVIITDLGQRTKSA